MSKTIQLLVAAGVGAVAIGSAVYLLNRQSNLEKKKLRHNKMTTLRVKIPLEKLSIVMGVQGETIQEIRWKSKARIDFETDPIDGARIAVIRGSQEETQLAEVLIYQILSFEGISDYLEISIPKASIDTVTGANNQNLDYIKKVTNCDVSLSKQKSNFKAQTLVLRGKNNEINAARAIILQKVEEFQAEKGETSSKVPTLFLTVEGYNEDHPDENTCLIKTLPKVEPLKATSGDGLIEILISSICDPFEFYVQLVGVSSVQLDKLVEDMTIFYEQDTNRKAVDPTQIKSGDLVAARFSTDGRWYRALVVMITVDDYDDSRADVDVDFVDFGDFQVKSLSDIAILHPQFLKLNFQAIKCSIANIRPANSRTWSDQAIDDFECLTHAGSWKSLLARVVNHRLETSNNQTISVPCLNLIDASKETDIDIATELVRLGHAVFSDTSTSSSTLQTPVLDSLYSFEDSSLDTSLNGTNHG